MTHEEILERVKKKSTICPKCGCFVSSLLDCCPACERKEKSDNNYVSASDSYLSNAYISIGGNAATSHSYDVFKIREDGTISTSKRQSCIVIDNLTDIGNVKAEIGRVVYIRNTNQMYIYTNQQWTQVYVPSLYKI